MRKTAKEIKYLSTTECQELFNKIKTDNSRHRIRNIAMFAMIKYCALRASEISLLRMCDYDHINKSIFIHRLKGSRSNTLILVDPEVISSFEHYYWLRKQEVASVTDIIFMSQKGTPISRKTLDTIMRKYCYGTGIPLEKHHVHVLKHTRAMELIDYPGVELKDVQWYLGHKNIQNTMIYLDYSVKAMKALFEKIAIKEGGISYANTTAQSQCYF